MKMMKTINIPYRNTLASFLALLLLSVSAPAGAQVPQLTEPLKTGEAAPDFSLKVQGPLRSKKRQMQLSDFSGRWLVIDFWTRSCILCIKGMPKLSDLQKQFSGKIDFLVVGKNDPKHGKGIEKLYERIRKSEQLELYAAFDTASFTSYRVRSTPHVAIISPNGKLYAQTVTEWLDSHRLQGLLDGKKPVFPQVNWGTDSVQFNISRKLFKASSLGDRDGQGFGSSLSPWRRRQGFQKALDLDSFVHSPSYATSTATLSKLYLVSAFGKGEWRIGEGDYGRVWPRPVLEMADTSLFISSSQKEQGIYNYRLELKSDTGKKALMAALSADLEKRLGYRATIQQRPMPVLELVVIDQGLASRTASTSAFKMDGGPEGYRLTGISTPALLKMLAYYLSGKLFYDESGIGFPMDLELQVSMINLKTVRAALNSYGLDLRPSMRTLPVLVISDLP